MLTKAVLLSLQFYKLAVSPYLPSQCSYMPTCSEYAAEAVQTYGAFRGSWMAIRRLARCHPFANGGYDPVPQSTEEQ